MRRIYLDHNATTPVAPEVLAAMLPYFAEGFGNASSIHSFGQTARAATEAARHEVAELIGAREGEIVFTSGGTEADNLAIFGTLAASSRPQTHVITSRIEHHAVLHSCQELERRGVAVTYLPVGAAGIVDPDDVRRALTADTVLITIMQANNELGTIQPIVEIAAIAAEHGITMHTDAVQTVAKIPVDVRRLGVGLLSLSAHKFYGPKGVGALYVKKGTRLKPILYGGHHERDYRAGTENVPGIVGLGRAAQLARENLATDAARLTSLRDRLESSLLEAIANSGVNGDRARRVPNTSNLYFEGVEGEALVIALDLKGVACSTGAACASGAVEPSHVLTAIGSTPARARGSLRLSLGRSTTAEDLDYVLEFLPGVVAHLRELSPRYRKPVTA